MSPYPLGTWCISSSEYGITIYVEAQVEVRGVLLVNFGVLTEGALLTDELVEVLLAEPPEVLATIWGKRYFPNFILTKYFSRSVVAF